MDFDKWWLSVEKKCGIEEDARPIKRAVVRLIAKTAYENGRLAGEMSALHKIQDA